MVREFPIAEFMVKDRMWPFSTMMLDTYSVLKMEEEQIGGLQDWAA
jgi:hypothetical protein